MAAIQTTKKYTKNKRQVIEFVCSTTDSTVTYSDSFDIPIEYTVVNLQVGAQATAQTIVIQGSNDGTNWSSIASATKNSASTAGVSVFARDNGTGLIGNFPYYRLGNSTASAAVTVSLTF